MENPFHVIMVEKSNEALMEIILRMHDDYQPEAVDAARNELIRRNLTHDQIEQLTDWIHQKEAAEQEKRKNKLSWIESVKRYFYIPNDLPLNLKWGAWLIYISLLMDIIRVILLRHQDIAHTAIDGKTILPGILFVLIAYMIHTGKDWARLIFLSFLFTRLVLYPFYLISSFQTGLPFGILLSLALTARILALFLLFSRSTTDWYLTSGIQPNDFRIREMRKSVISLVIALVFGAYMFKPVWLYFNKLTEQSIVLTLLLVMGDAVLLVWMFFFWYGYMRRNFI